MPDTPDLDLMRDALATSTLSHGLKLLGDRWTMAVLLGAFLGVRRFDEWHARLQIPRPTLADRLRLLVDVGLLRQRLYQERPARYGYHLTSKSLAMYDHVLMSWAWERRWGDKRPVVLPPELVHRLCGHALTPQLACSACGEAVEIVDLQFSLRPNPALLPDENAEATRTPRVPSAGSTGMGLGLRVDRWVLLIVAAVALGCHYNDQLAHVLGIGSSVLARRLAAMEEMGLLQCEPDRHDGRRRFYRLTPPSRGLFGYIVCFSSWAAHHHFDQPSSIQPVHRTCGHAFVPQAACSHCLKPLKAWDVNYREPETQE